MKPNRVSAGASGDLEAELAPDLINQPDRLTDSRGKEFHVAQERMRHRNAARSVSRLMLSGDERWERLRSY